MIRFSVQGHRAGLPRDSMSAPVFSPGLRTQLGSATALKFQPVQVGNAYLRRRPLRVSCSKAVSGIVEKDDMVRQHADGSAFGLSVVMKFGGSSVATADRMREVVELILSFPEESPVIVLSAMGKTTNNLLLVNLVVLVYQGLHFVLWSNFCCQLFDISSILCNLGW